ncbi:MAG: ABC-type transporter, integral rane subunit [Gemmatimonadetes bacterium]|nr:ABC-type transporter, integral rane subunit [Gemmatimonadota bacterium]
MRDYARRLAGSQETGLVAVLFAATMALTLLAGSHLDRASGISINNFWNSHTLVQTATDASFFAIMAIGATMVIIAGGIDLSVGSIYALSGVGMALALRGTAPASGGAALATGLTTALGIGLLCGFLNGVLVVGLRVHPFIITLGTMWILRGIAFVATKAESILVPASLTSITKASLGLGGGLFPVPMLAMLALALIGTIYLARTVMGRHIFAFGGNPEASRYAGLSPARIQIGVFVVSGLTAGLAAFLGASFYGSASSGDAQGYELYVIASAVVGGASLTGGKGSALGATLGALLIVLIRQSIRTLHFDQNYEWIVIGCAIIIAVVVDRWTMSMTQRRFNFGTGRSA